MRKELKEEIIKQSDEMKKEFKEEIDKINNQFNDINAKLN